MSSEAELLKAYRELIAQGLPAILFREADMGDQATALASAPIVGKDRKAFSKYKLWREPQPAVI